MTATSECAWTRDVCAYLRDRLACIVKAEFAGSKFQQPGWPDRWLCHTLWVGWLEFKGDETRVTLLQRKRMADIWNRQPASVFIVRRGVDCNLIQHHYDDELLGLWRCPEELLLQLHAIKMKTYQEHEDQIAKMRAIAFDAVIQRLKR